MKKIFFLILCLMFSLSVSAHEKTTTFQHQPISKILVLENAQMHPNMYANSNGGILQLIYNVFYKVGSIISTTLDNEELPKEEEIATGN